MLWTNVAISWWLLSVPLYAELIPYEPLDYKIGELLLGQTNGFGFTSPWMPAGFNARVPEGFEMRAGGLQFQTLAITGTNHVAADGIPKEYPRINGTIWISN